MRRWFPRESSYRAPFLCPVVTRLNPRRRKIVHANLVEWSRTDLAGMVGIAFMRHMLVLSHTGGQHSPLQNATDKMSRCVARRASCGYVNVVPLAELSRHFAKWVTTKLFPEHDGATVD